MNFGENMESNVAFHIQDVAERLLKEIEQVMKNVENSKFYAGMHLDLKGNETIQKHLVRLLGSHSHVQVVIYGLGSIEYSFHSQFQLAAVLLLKRDFSNWIGNIVIYDPNMSSADIIVFKKLGLEVLTIDDNYKRRTQMPTMFYMPNPYYYLIGNLLGANWCSSCLNQIFLLTNSFGDTLTNMPQCSRIERNSGFAWHFFDVDPNSDIDIPGCYWLDLQWYLEEDYLEDMQSDMTSKEFANNLGYRRGPRRLRCNVIPPPPGWIKLNIYGISTKGNQPGRFSGVFQDDNVIVGLEALRLGLVRCVEGKPDAEKLIVESDNVILVQYVNGRPEPNETTMYRLKEISDFLERITCAVHYIYEEANEAARDWALRGECPNSA